MLPKRLSKNREFVINGSKSFFVFVISYEKCAIMKNNKKPKPLVNRLND